MKVSAREARRRFSELLDAAERGEDVVVTRRGKPAVRLVVEPPDGARPTVPSLADFRASISIEGALSDAVIAGREER